MGLNKYEINSIGTNKSAKIKEVPEGKNKEKYNQPNFLIQIILIPIYMAKLNAKVTII